MESTREPVQLIGDGSDRKTPEHKFSHDESEEIRCDQNSTPEDIPQQDHSNGPNTDSPKTNGQMHSKNSIKEKNIDAPMNGTNADIEDDDLMSALDQELSTSQGSSIKVSDLQDEIQRLEISNKHLEEKLLASKQQGETEIETLKKLVSTLQFQNQGLQKTISDQFNEITMWKERIEANDQAARKAIDGYKKDHQTNIDKIMKKYNECKADREGMVVKYAQGETKLSMVNVTNEKLELKVKEKEREKEVLLEKQRSLKTENGKLVSQLAEKVKELESTQKSLEKNKETVSSQDYRTKWAQNKLKSELEAHKETKLKLEEMTRRLREQKEESVQIRENCQEMVKTYQESEEIRSNSLDLELKKKEAELHEKTTSLQTATTELENANSSIRHLTEQLNILQQKTSSDTSKLNELEIFNQTTAKSLEEQQSCIASLREENSQVRLKLEELKTLQQEIALKTTECADLQQQVNNAEQASRDTIAEMDSCKTREGEMLELTQKMTERNAELQSENSVLKAKVAGLEHELSQKDIRLKCLEEETAKKANVSEEEMEKMLQENIAINAHLTEKEKKVLELQGNIDQQSTEIKTLKKKQVSSVKELTREVHTLRRQLDVYETRHTDEAGRQSSPSRKSGSAPVSLQHSRTNSTSSLDKPDGGWVVVNQRGGSPDTANQRRLSADLPEEQSQPSDQLEPHFMEPDKQRLIEKIVKLQRAHARKNEKLDFCEDHIRQLIEEVQRKARIIQMYVMKEEAGTLSSNTMDRNKDSIAKKGGIMASINSQHAQDGRMSLELSLQINHKLQAVLEDTLLKNITLKENMDTLGAEIARLSQQIRQGET